MADKPRTPVVCSGCQHTWKTKKDPQDAVCPNCGCCWVMRKLPKAVIKAARAAIIRMMPGAKKPEPEKLLHYTVVSCNRFVRFLGCWSRVDVPGAMMLRDQNQHDKAEYRRRLENLIRVNKTRLDAVGRAETKAAEIELKEMGA